MIFNKRDIPSVNTFNNFFRRYNFETILTEKDIPDLFPYVKNEDLTYYLKISDIINNLTSGGIDKPLSAEQGKTIWDTLDIETGTWTPVPGNTTGSDPTISSYTYQRGVYFKINHIVFISCLLYFDMTSVGSNTYACVKGLPYPADLTLVNGAYYVLGAGQMYKVSTLGDTYNHTVMIRNGLPSYVWIYSNNGSSATCWEAEAGKRVVFSGFYLTGITS